MPFEQCGAWLFSKSDSAHWRTSISYTRWSDHNAKWNPWIVYQWSNECPVVFSPSLPGSPITRVKHLYYQLTERPQYMACGLCLSWWVRHCTGLSYTASSEVWSKLEFVSSLWSQAIFNIPPTALESWLIQHFATFVSLNQVATCCRMNQTVRHSRSAIDFM